MLQLPDSIASSPLLFPASSSPLHSTPSLPPLAPSCPLIHSIPVPPSSFLPLSSFLFHILPAQMCLLVHFQQMNTCICCNIECIMLRHYVLLRSKGGNVSQSTHLYISTTTGWIILKVIHGPHRMNFGEPLTFSQAVQF